MTKYHEAGKGSASRPKQVSNEDYAARWDAIFGKDLPEDEEEPKGRALKDESLENENDD